MAGKIPMEEAVKEALKEQEESNPGLTVARLIKADLDKANDLAPYGLHE